MLVLRSHRDPRTDAPTTREWRQDVASERVPRTSQPSSFADDARYLRWLLALEQGQGSGNPPGSRLLDIRIGHLASQYPEYSYLDIEQARLEDETRRRW